MDDSLDDFFAKKDKSKKKSKSSKSKFVPADLLPLADPELPSGESGTDPTQQFNDLQIDDAEGKKKKSKRRKDKDSADSARNDDDEWNEVNNEVDYSGLKIASKSIAKREEETLEASQMEPEYDEDGQIIERKADEVWKIAAPPQPSRVDDELDAKPVELEPIRELAKAIPEKYVPPSRRSESQLEPVRIKRMTRGRKTDAPNITSEDDFPTLGAAPPPIDPDAASFEKVKGGSTQQQSSNVGPARVETSNMYSALGGS